MSAAERLLRRGHGAVDAAPRRMRHGARSRGPKGCCYKIIEGDREGVHAVVARIGGRRICVACQPAADRAKLALQGVGWVAPCPHCRADS